MFSSVRFACSSGTRSNGGHQIRIRPKRLSCVGWQTHNFLQAALMPMELKARGEVEYSLNGVEISNPTGRANL